MAIALRKGKSLKIYSRIHKSVTFRTEPHSCHPMAFFSSYATSSFLVSAHKGTVKN